VLLMRGADYFMLCVHCVVDGGGAGGSVRKLDSSQMSMVELKRRWGFVPDLLAPELQRLEAMNHIASARRESLRAARL
jgi:hypothetical protein